MARGAESKNIIFNKLLEVFPGSFMYNDGKELRIPMNESGVEVQIKVALTAAKENVTSGAVASAIEQSAFPAPAETAPKIEVTQEEKDNIAALLSGLGL